MKLEPYIALANAIVIQAAIDYRRVCIDADCNEKRELLKFFFSEYFVLLTKIDPVWLTEKLEAIEREKRKKVNRKTEALFKRGKVLPTKS